MTWSPGLADRRKAAPVRVTRPDGTTEVVKPGVFRKASSADYLRAQYRAYLQSPAWKAIRQQVLVRDAYACTTCGATSGKSIIEVHHLTYERFGHELLEDLITLCRPCHAKVHSG